MQSIRRAAFRSVVSASRAVSSPARSTPFAAQISRQSVVPVARQSAIIAARFFSQTCRVAEEERLSEDQSANQESVRERRPRSNETDYGVFVRNLVFDTTDEHLAALFEKFGTIERAVVARDQGNMSRGYGFVYFTNKQDQQEAIRAIDGTFFHGRRLGVTERLRDRDRNPGAHRRAPRGSPSGPTNCLFFGNISYETTDAELNELFSGLDGVVDVRVAVDRTTGWPRGFCHVDFKDEEAAQAAMEQMKNVQLRERQLTVDFASARSAYGGRKRGPEEGQGFN